MENTTDNLQNPQERTQDVAVIAEALAELQTEGVPEIEMRTGAQQSMVEAVMTSTAEKLVLMDNSLSMHAAFTITWGVKGMLSHKEKEHVEAVLQSHPEEVAQILQEKERALVTRASESQILPPGILSDVPYHQEEGYARCAAATFLSLYEGITGEAISEAEFITLAKQFGFERDLGSISWHVLDTLVTKAFRNAYPNLKVTLYKVGCFDFDDLQKIKTLSSVSNLYFVPDLRSEVSPDSKFTHLVTLLAADEKTVTVHDPSRIVGSAYRQLPRQDFFERWASQLFEGTLIIVQK